MGNLRFHIRLGDSKGVNGVLSCCHQFVGLSLLVRGGPSFPP